MAALAAATPPQAPRLMPLRHVHQDVEDLHTALNGPPPSLERVGSLAIRMDLDHQRQTSDLGTSMALDYSNPSLDRIRVLATRIALHHQRQTSDLRTLLASLSAYPLLIRAHVLRASYNVLKERAIEGLPRYLDAGHLHESPEVYIQTIAAEIQALGSAMDRQIIVQDILDVMAEQKNEGSSSSVASPASLPEAHPGVVKAPTSQAQAPQALQRRPEDNQAPTKRPSVAISPEASIAPIQAPQASQRGPESGASSPATHPHAVEASIAPIQAPQALQRGPESGASSPTTHPHAVEEPIAQAQAPQPLQRGPEDNQAPTKRPSVPRQLLDPGSCCLIL